MNILVVRTDKLGDFITALPTLYTLKRYHHNRVSVLVSPINKALAQSCDFIDDVIVDEGQSVFTLANTLRHRHFDASLTLFSNTRVALAQFMALIPQRIAPATKVAQIFYNKRIKQRRSQVKMAEFEYNLELTKALFKDIEFTYPQPLLHYDVSKIYSEFSSNNGITKPVIAFHMGFGGSSDANLTLDEYSQLIQIVLHHGGYNVVLTFGPDDKEIYHQAMQSITHSEVVFYNSKLSLVDFAALLSCFNLFVSTSTGPYHLAAAVGTPTFTFFADSLFASAKRWKAISDPSLQTHFMLKADEAERNIQFSKIKNALKMQLTD